MEACVDVERGLLFCDESAMFILPRPNLSEHDLGCMVLSPSHFTIWTNKKVPSSKLAYFFLPLSSFLKMSFVITRQSI